MPTINLREGDTFEGAIRRFKRLIEKTRILQETRLREYHLSGSIIKQRKKAAAKKRWAKKLARDKYNLREHYRSGRNQVSLNKANMKSNNFKPGNNASRTETSVF